MFCDVFEFFARKSKYRVEQQAVVNFARFIFIVHRDLFVVFHKAMDSYRVNSSRVRDRVNYRKMEQMVRSTGE